MTIEPVALDAAPRRAAAKLMIDGVSKRFGTGADAVQALKPIDIAVGAGEFLTIVGPSGCGKSTLLNLVCRLLLEKKKYARHPRACRAILAPVRPSAAP